MITPVFCLVRKRIHIWLQQVILDINPRLLVKNYALSLGFKYLTASTKEDFLNMYEQFTDSNNREAPMILEAFTDSKDESNAVYAYRHIIKECVLEIKNKAKRIVKDIIKR